MAVLEILTKLSFVLFLGVIMGLIAKRVRLPPMLLLILSGVILSNINVNGQPFIQFTNDFLISASILALVMIVFKDSSTFSLKDVDIYSESAAKIAVIFLVLNMLFLSVAVFSIFHIGNVLLSLLFAAVMSGTDPGAVLSLFQTKSNRVTDILKFESVINTPIIVLIPFILLDVMEIGEGIFTNFLGHFYPFLQQIITGIGTGVFVGIIVFRFMRRFYSERLSPLTLITSALLTYIISENLGGNGVLAVTVLGVFFGNVTVKKKLELLEFSAMLSNTLEIIVFVLIGFLLPLNLDLWFVVKSVLLFIIMIVLRFGAIQIVYISDHINLKERIFMALNCTKGIAVAVVAFLVSTYVLQIPTLQEGVKVLQELPVISIPGSQTIIDLMVLFIIYSIILSSIMARFSQNFIRLKVEGD